MLHKWLKDRKGRTLAFADLHHYQKVVVALAETIRLMAEIDAAIEAHRQSITGGCRGTTISV